MSATVQSADSERHAKDRVKRAVTLGRRMDGLRATMPTDAGFVYSGRLKRAVGLTLEAEGCSAPLGARVSISGRNDTRIAAEVVGFVHGRSLLMPLSGAEGLTPDALVTLRANGAALRIGDDWLGRVVDATGRALDDRPDPRGQRALDLAPKPINPLTRARIDQPLDVGVRAINGLLTLGRGQRVGLFAGSGVGKSTLLGMMTRNTQADVVVVGLIGERGREVADFVHETLGPVALARACVVAAPADAPPLARLHGAWLATAVAEYFRDQGLSVLLLMDSLTRFAHAAREIGLATGEPPATRGYPPSALARLPQLVERAGNGSGPGSITAIYTVLVDGDDLQEPVADAARAVLDGHIVLSRTVAESGRFPAIDIEASVSRVMEAVTAVPQQQAARRLRRLLAAYSRHRDLITIGAYKAGSDADTDEALARWSAIEAFLQQATSESASLDASNAALANLFKEPLA